MKTNEIRSAVPGPSTTQKPDATKKAAFAKALEDAKPQVVSAMPAALPVAPAVEEAESVRSVASPSDLAGLEREIGAALRVKEGKEVEIRFDSKTLAGLEIRIRKEDGKLNVKLRCDSPGINRLLTEQLDTLAARLETRGYSGVKVELHAEPRPVTFASPRNRGDQRGQGQPGQQRQRQK